MSNFLFLDRHSELREIGKAIEFQVFIDPRASMTHARTFCEKIIDYTAQHKYGTSLQGRTFAEKIEWFASRSKDRDIVEKYQFIRIYANKATHEYYKDENIAKQCLVNAWEIAKVFQKLVDGKEYRANFNWDLVTALNDDFNKIKKFNENLMVATNKIDNLQIDFNKQTAAYEERIKNMDVANREREQYLVNQLDKLKIEMARKGTAVSNNSKDEDVIQVFQTELERIRQGNNNSYQSLQQAFAAEIMQLRRNPNSDETVIQVANLARAHEAKIRQIEHENAVRESKLSNQIEQLRSEFRLGQQPPVPMKVGPQTERAVKGSVWRSYRNRIFVISVAVVAIAGYAFLSANYDNAERVNAAIDTTAIRATNPATISSSPNNAEANGLQKYKNYRLAVGKKNLQVGEETIVYLPAVDEVVRKWILKTSDENVLAIDNEKKIIKGIKPGSVVLVPAFLDNETEILLYDASIQIVVGESEKNRSLKNGNNIPMDGERSAQQGLNTNQYRQDSTSKPTIDLSSIQIIPSKTNIRMGETITVDVFPQVTGISVVSDEQSVLNQNYQKFIGHNPGTARLIPVVNSVRIEDKAVTISVGKIPVGIINRCRRESAEHEVASFLEDTGIFEVVYTKNEFKGGRYAKGGNSSVYSNSQVYYWLGKTRIAGGAFGRSGGTESNDVAIVYILQDSYAVARERGVNNQFEMIQ